MGFGGIRSGLEVWRAGGSGRTRLSESIISMHFSRIIRYIYAIYAYIHMLIGKN